MTLCHKIMKKTRRRVLPVVIFLVVAYILYKRLISDKRSKVASLVAETKPSELLNPSPKNAWVIVFTDTDLCIEIATSFSNYQVLLAGQLQEPSAELRHSRCHYLTGKDMKPLQNHHSIVKLHRRANAFLYAIQHNAEEIYILSGKPNDQQSHSSTQSDSNSHFYSLVGSSEPLFDPISHWGCNFTAQRMLPFLSSSSIVNYKLCKLKQPIIQTQGSFIVEHKPESSLVIDLGMSCDRSAPSVTLTSDTYTFLSDTDTLYMREAFWALPVFQLYPEEEIAVSFILQKILWLNGHHVMITPGDSMKISKTASTLDVNIIKFLKAFRCESDMTSCAINIFEQAESKELVSHSTTKSFQAWLNLLQKNKYDFKDVLNDKIIMECKDENTQFFPVNHKVPYSIKKWRPTPFLPVNNLNSIQDLHHNTCDNVKIDTGVKIHFPGPWTQWNDVLLIIVFNNPIYDVIPYTEMLYRSFFPNILYCGPGNPDANLLKKFDVSFISYGGTPAGHFPGSFNYECLIMATHMNYKVKGYLVIADDLLIVPKRLNDLNLDQPWYLPQTEVKIADMKTLRECRLGMCDFHSHWRWFEDYQSAVLNTLSELESKQSGSQLIKKCYQTLALVNNGKYNVNGAYSDIYYIPSYLIPEFVELAQIFLNNYAFLEITVPSILRCLVPLNDIVPLRGKQIWDESRDESWAYFTEQEMVYKSYLHPTKWSNILKQSHEYIQFFCKAVSYLHDPYGRIG